MRKASHSQKAVSSLAVVVLAPVLLSGCPRGGAADPKRSANRLELAKDYLGRGMLEQALQQSGGNQTRAAQRLGISRDTLRYRMKKYGLGG